MPGVFLPTPERVDKACEDFDVENRLAERALEDLFKQYPGNAIPEHVLLKVVAVNTLYRTNIFAVIAVAEHISKNVPGLDLSLQSADPTVVEKISRIKIGSANKERNLFSFASKFCSWHNPEGFPIYDSRVEEYLWALQKQAAFSDRFKRRDDLWNYVSFQQIVSDLRSKFDLSGYSFKEIDKFMYTYSKASPVAVPECDEPLANI